MRRYDTPVKELVVIVPDSHLIESMMALESHDLRLPGLARVARFASAQPLSLSWRAWLAAWLGMDDSSVPPAAVAALALPDEDATPEGAVWFAQPVHWVASLTTLHLPAHGLLRLASAEQQLLVESFAASFASAGFRLRALPSGGFLALGTALPDGIETLDPAQCLGANLAEALPQGPGAAALRRLGAEIEMWLHEHPVNITRMRAGRRGHQPGRGGRAHRAERGCLHAWTRPPQRQAGAGSGAELRRARTR